MIPPPDHTCWPELVTGARQLRSANLSFNMLVFTVRRRYANDPSAANLAALSGHVRDFCVKFETLLAADLAGLDG